VVPGGAGVAIVEVRGEHDLSTEAVLREALRAAATRASVVADLTECTFADSTALAVLIRAAQAAAARRDRFAVVIPPDSRAVARVAAMIGLGDTLALHPTRESALRSLEPSTGKSA
jgi:anti-anti-sigma factor